jgi:limonene-1,2-epoxide hydrolase
MTKNMFSLIVMAWLAVTLSGCAGRDRASYVVAYHEASSRFNGAPVDSSAPIERFKAVYADLKGADLAERIDAAYAETLYFNDTLHTFDNRAALSTYLQQTAERVDSVQVDVSRVIVDGADVWLQWRMKTRARALGRSMQAETIGMTHLRFDSNGQVVLHQDYWDSTEGVFSHLPFIGGLVRWTRNRL